MEAYNQALPQVVQSEQSFIRRVYNWMFMGLGLTAFVSYTLYTSPDMLRAYVSSPLYMGSIIGELVLIFWAFRRIQTMSTAKATFFFFLYAFLNGMTLTPILIQYTGASIFSTFVVTAGTFGVTSFIGYTTKKDLSSIGGFIMMGMVGLIIASVVNMFMQSTQIYWILSYAGVALSIGVTAYYTQAIKKMSQGQYENKKMESNAAIMGALMLYVAFIMMFVYLLRFFGSRR